MRCRTLARLPVAREPGETSLGVSRLLRSRAVVIVALAQLACAGPAAYSNVPMLVGLPPSAGAANSTAASLDSEGGRQLQTTVTMADNTNNAHNDITSYGFDLSPTDYAAVVFAQPSLAYKCYSETTLKISIYKVSGTTNSRTITVQLQCLAGSDASFLPGTSLGSVSSVINVPNSQSFFSITVSTLADIAGYSGCELRGQASAPSPSSSHTDSQRGRREEPTPPIAANNGGRPAGLACFSASLSPTLASQIRVQWLFHRLPRASLPFVCYVQARTTPLCSPALVRRLPRTGLTATLRQMPATCPPARCKSHRCSQPTLPRARLSRQTPPWGFLLFSCKARTSRRRRLRRG